MKWIEAILAGWLAMAGVSDGATFTITNDATGNETAISQSSGTAPGFETQPASQLVTNNGTVYFSFLATGSGPLSYQWLSNGVPIPGATGDVLAVSNVIAPTNLVVNGNFETPFVNGADSGYTAGQNIGGWIVETNTVYLIDTLWNAAVGVQSMDLGPNPPGAIHQDVATVPGQQYYLHLAVSGDPRGTPVIKTNQVWWDGSLLDTITFDTTGHSLSAMGWTNHEYVVTASTTTTRVRFVSLVTGSFGPVIDNVTLEAVPPPPANYSVIVSNASGTVTSTVAQIQFDVDGNGLADSWERTYFGSIGQDPNADSDGDGISNLTEFQDGTNPTNAASFLAHPYVSATPGGTVTINPAQLSYAQGSPVALTAWPQAGYLFGFWTGSILSNQQTVNLTMNTSETITAIFGLAMVNGGDYDGAMAPGGTNIYAFTATNGQTIRLRLGSFGFNGQFQLYGPDGSLLQTAANGGGTDWSTLWVATNSGVFSVMVSAYGGSGTGTYRLHYFQDPGSFIVPAGDDGGPMTNGGNYAGTIDLGDLDPWSFTANAGDNVALRLASTGFSGSLGLYGPNGGLVATSAGNGTDWALNITATNSGTYVALVGSYFSGGTGSYVLHYFKAPGAYIVPAGDDGGLMTNGGDYAGTITLADIDPWSFTANAGDNLVLRLGSTGFEGTMTLYGPDGSVLSTSGGNGTDWIINYRATNSGTFTVLVSSYFGGGTGSYVLHYFDSTSGFVVPPGDEGGPMTNGGNYAGTLALGDLDPWSFTANTGDNLVLRLGSTGFEGTMTLYGPDGSVLSASGGNGTDWIINYRATNSGTFTVLVSSYFGGGTGSYVLHYFDSTSGFIVPAGDEGGPMTNGGSYPGTILLADIDPWSLTANAGDNLVLRLGSTGFNGTMTLYGPDGSLLSTSGGNGADWIINYRATNSGTFTVLVSSYNGAATGSYVLHYFNGSGAFIVSPGDDGGPMVNGGTYNGTLNIGDLDPWSFTATAGDNLVLRLGSTGFNGQFQLYAPNGALLQTVGGNSGDWQLLWTATNAGTYKVLVSSYTGGQSGTYQLHFFDSVGSYVVPTLDEGGAMTNGGNYDGAIYLGDLDPWSFTANAGDNVQLRLGTGGFNGQFFLYGPDGSLLQTVGGNSTDWPLRYAVTNTGTYTALVSAFNLGGTGSYRLHYFNGSGSFIVPALDDGGAMVNGGNYNGDIDLGDLDPWSFTANAGDTVVLRIGTTNFSPRMDVYNPAGSLSATGFFSGGRDAYLSYPVTNAGSYTVVVSDDLTTEQGGYRLHYLKLPGSYIVPPGDEGGAISGGKTNVGANDLGDMDIWSFTAFRSNAISLNGLKLTGTSTYFPRLWLYGPSGALLTNAGGTASVAINYTPTNSGTYTVLVGSFNLGETGTYQLSGTGFSAGLDLGTPNHVGTNVSLTLTGGLSNSTFVLYGTTNVTQPDALWTPLLTNHFDSNGSYLATNLFNPLQPQKYFRFGVP